MNQTLINMLKTLEEKEKLAWKDHLDKLAFSYNVTKHKTTGFSPFFLVFGREPNLPIDTMFAAVGDEKLKRRSYDEYAKEWQRSMEQAFNIVKEHTKKKTGENEKQYNKKIRGVEIVEGDRVLLRNDGQKGGTGKLKNYWENEVYVVVKKHDDLPIYTVKSVNGKKKSKVIHRNRLMPCNNLLVEKETTPAKKKMKTKRKQNDVIVLPQVEDAVPFVVRDVEAEQLESEDEFIVVEAEAEEETVPCEPTIVDSDHDNEVEEGNNAVSVETEGVESEVRSEVVVPVADEVAEGNDVVRVVSNNSTLTTDDLEQLDVIESDEPPVDECGFVELESNAGSEQSMISNASNMSPSVSSETAIGNAEGENVDVSDVDESDNTVAYDESALMEDEDNEDDEEAEERYVRPRRVVSAPKVLTYDESGEAVWERREVR